MCHTAMNLYDLMQYTVELLIIVIGILTNSQNSMPCQAELVHIPAFFHSFFLSYTIKCFNYLVALYKTTVSLISTISKSVVSGNQFLSSSSNPSSISLSENEY